MRPYSGSLEAEPPSGVHGRAPGPGVRNKAEYIHFLMPKGGRNLAHCQTFLSSFEIGPTEQVFLPNRYPD